MDDAQLDLSDDVADLGTVSDDAAVRKPFWVAPFIGLCFLLFALFLIAGQSARNAKSLIHGSSDAFLSFQNLSNETHTGLRLARLEDFLAQYPDSAHSNAARARKNALKTHEEKSWARLTDAFYDAKADQVAKSLAIKTYTDIWTPLLRPEQLKSLEQVLPDDAVPNFKPGARKSRFSSGGNDQFLEGGPINRSSAPSRAFKPFSEPQRLGRSSIVNPTIRGEQKKPSYPNKARRGRVEADVVLELNIDDRGRVRQVRVVSVNAERFAGDFAKAAKKAARKQRYRPKTINGRPVSTSGHIQKYAFKFNP